MNAPKAGMPRCAGSGSDLHARPLVVEDHVVVRDAVRTPGLPATLEVASTQKYGPDSTEGSSSETSSARRRNAGRPSSRPPASPGNVRRRILRSPGTAALESPGTMPIVTILLEGRSREIGADRSFATRPDTAIRSCVIAGSDSASGVVPEPPRCRRRVLTAAMINIAPGNSFTDCGRSPGTPRPSPAGAERRPIDA